MKFRHSQDERGKFHFTIFARLLFPAGENGKRRTGLDLSRRFIAAIKQTDARLSRETRCTQCVKSPRIGFHPEERNLLASQSREHVRDLDRVERIDFWKWNSKEHLRGNHHARCLFVVTYTKSGSKVLYDEHESEFDFEKTVERPYRTSVSGSDRIVLTPRQCSRIKCRSPVESECLNRNEMNDARHFPIWKRIKMKTNSRARRKAYGEMRPETKNVEVSLFQLCNLIRGIVASTLTLTWVGFPLSI